MKDPSKAGGKPATGKSPPAAPPKQDAKAKAKDAAAAAKRLARMTPEEQAAELFKTMIGSSGRKSR